MIVLEDPADITGVALDANLVKKHSNNIVRMKTIECASRGSCIIFSSSGRGTGRGMFKCLALIFAIELISGALGQD